LAGLDDLNVTLRESGAVFKFNFADVYWNSRLQMEHSRLIDEIFDAHTAAARSGHRLVVADMMAGVGPFGVPLAKRGVLVHANGRNTSSRHIVVLLVTSHVVTIRAFTSSTFLNNL
jgi:tRNA (guanine37-N1)-methyltransferase